MFNIEYAHRNKIRNGIVYAFNFNTILIATIQSSKIFYFSEDI